MKRKINNWQKLIALTSISIFIPKASLAENKPLPVKTPAGEALKYGEKVSIYQSGQNDFSINSLKKLDHEGALSSFKFFFENSDHKINQIGVDPVLNMAFVRFKDKDGNDPYNFGGIWWNIPGVQKNNINFLQGSTGTERIAPIPTGYVPAINGFVFHTANGTDCSIKGMNVGFNNDATNATAILDNDCGRNFLGQLTYVLIPESKIVGKFTISGTGNRKVPLSGQLPANSKYVIRSFNFKYTDNSHFLRGVGVHLDDVKIGRDAITWQDNNTDDPIYWSVEYYVLK